MNETKNSLEDHISRLAERLRTAQRIHENIDKIKNCSESQLRGEMLNGKLGELVAREYEDSLPCTSPAYTIYYSYLSLREEGKYPEVAFFERLKEIMGYAREKIELHADEHIKDKREFELYERFQNIGGLNNDEIGELVRIEEHGREYHRAINIYIIVGRSLIGDRRVHSFKGLAESKEKPPVKFYERRLTEKEYRYFMETPTEEIVDDLISKNDIRMLDKDDSSSPSFEGFNWVEVPPTTPMHKVSKRLIKWKKERSRKK